MSARSEFEFELRYDLRNPEQWHCPWDRFYAQFLDQVQWADENGFDVVDLNEHHFSDDGYLPSPVTMAAAIAARTKRIKIRLGVVLLPLKHPLQLAEELAVVDILSAGRLEVCIGAGYRQEEYDGFGISMKERGSRMEEGLEIIRRCWEEDCFSFNGRHWQLSNVRARPKPFQKPRPHIVVGGSTVAAAQRAARLGDGFIPVDLGLLKPWRDEMIRVGKDPDAALELITRQAIGAATYVFVAEDPDAAWKAISPHVLYFHNSYAVWTSKRGLSMDTGSRVSTTTAEDLLKTGAYGVFTPEQIVDRARAAISSGVHAKLRLQPMIAGLPLALGQPCLELVASKVIPHVRKLRLTD